MAQNEQKLALVKSKLQMPIIIRDLLITDQAPSAESTYALHDMMSSFQPDAAILSAAFTMKEIADIEDALSEDISFLHMECDRIIERYIARDEMAEENPELWSETQSEMMPVIAEDIEGFLELISLCYLSYDITNPKIAKIVNILNVQLQSHLMIVDEVITLQEDIKRQAALSTPAINGYMADNVVMFPG